MQKVFWKCGTGGRPKDGFFTVNVLMNVFSLVLNLVLLVLVFLLKGPIRSFLYQLRTLIASVVFCNFLKICDHLISTENLSDDYTTGLFICHVWGSHYICMVAHTFMAMVLNFTVGNRAIQIVWRYQLSYSSSRISDLANLGALGLVSLICLFPRAYQVHWDNGRCRCHDHNVAYAELVSLYTVTFVHFGLTAIISTFILGISCFKVISWVRKTPAKQLSDTWNSLAFTSTTKEQREAFSQPKGWMTASLCIIPLSVNFLVIDNINTGYKFVCALGFCKLSSESPFSIVDEILCDLELIIIPIIFIIYIPAIRELCLRVCRWIIRICQEPWKRRIWCIRSSESNR